MKRKFILFFTIFSLSSFAGFAQFLGDGTGENPYLISSAEDLSYMCELVNSGDETYRAACYKQMNDIVINEAFDGGDIQEWTPIGTTDYPFLGDYDGGHFKIKGLYINNTSYSCQGLFGKNEGCIRNLGVVDSYISACNNVAGIVGENYGDVSFCYNESDVYADTYAGGVAGVNYGSIAFCYNLGRIQVKFGTVGGITSLNSITSLNTCSISNCYNAGEISGGSSAGGISGTDNFGTIKNCYNIGCVPNGYPVSSNYDSSEKLYYDKQVVSSKYVDGRAKGFTTTEMLSNVFVEEEHWECNGELYPQIEGIQTEKSKLYATPIYLSNNETIDKIYSGFRVSLSNDVHWSSQNGLVEIDFEGNATILSAGEDVLVAQLGEYTRVVPIRIIEEPNIDGVGTHANPYKISTAEELLKVVGLINSGVSVYDKICYKITAPIILNENLLDRIAHNDTEGLVKWTPIKNFSGEFMGSYFNRIRGLYIKDEQAMFVENYGTISSLYLEDCFVEGNAAICYENHGSIENCGLLSSKVVGRNGVAGVCCYNYGNMLQILNWSDIEGRNDVAGICSYNKGVISFARNDANVTASFQAAGGVVSQNTGQLEHCTNSGTITSDYNGQAGGIVCGAVSGEINCCVNSGLVRGHDILGGIFAYQNFGFANNCYNIGYISSKEGKQVGAISGTYFLSSQGSNYYDCQTSGVGDSYAIGLTTLEMTNGNVFCNSTLWIEEEGYYPQFPGSYIFVSSRSPLFLSNNETVDDIRSDFAVDSYTTTYVSTKNRVQFDKEGNAKISSIGCDTLIIDGRRRLPIRITENPNEIVKPDAYYALCDEKGNYLSADQSLGLVDNLESSSIFYLEEGNELLSYKSGVYVSESARLEKVGDKGTALSFSEGTIGNTVCVGLSKDIYLGSNGTSITTTESNWKLQEVTSLPVTITEGGYVSFYAPVEVTLPNGIEAYYITADGISAEVISLSLIEERVVPANTGVILASQTPATYELIISCTNVPAIENSLLEGTVAATNISDKAYVLSSINGNMGFYLVEMNKDHASAFTNNSHEAYLPQDAIPIAMQGSIGFRLMEQPLLDSVKATITISKYGSSTYCSSHNLDFSGVNGLKAYAATGYNTRTGVVTLTRVMTAKAGEGLFIKGEPGDYKVPVMENTDDNTLNMLVGTLTDTEVNGTSTDGAYTNYKYTIKVGESEPMFYQFEDGSTLTAERAYLQIPTTWLPQTESKAIKLRFVNGETTDIEEIELTENGHQTMTIYDFTGRRVDVPVKGGVYIVSGKKVVY